MSETSTPPAPPTESEPDLAAPVEASGDHPSEHPSDQHSDQPSGEEAGGPSKRLARLEEEGDVAADYLEELLDIADLDGDIDIDVEDGRASLSIVAEGDDAVVLKDLAGTRGEVLEALQELTRLAVQARTGERSRLMLDVAGYRAGRRADLEQLAREVTTRVREGGEPIALEPMNPFERKVVHDVVAAQGLVSDSEGVEPHRRVVVHRAQA